MRRPSEQHRRYNVRISPAAWGRIGSVPMDVFRNVEAELLAIAHRASSRNEVKVGPGGAAAALFRTLSVNVGDFVAEYAIDEETHAVVLTDIGRREDEES